MGGYAWVHHYQQGRRCVELWGADAAALIRYAEHVEALELTTSGDDESDVLSVAGERLYIERSIDITDRKGLVHARQALIEDASFTWNVTANETPEWKFALRFREEAGEATLVFDVAGHSVHLIGAERSGTVTPDMMAAYETKLPVWFGE